MAVLSENDLNILKKQAITDFNAKIDNNKNMQPKDASEAKANFKETVDPGFFGKLAKLGRAFISPFLAPFRTPAAKSIGKFLGDIASQGGGPLVAGVISMAVIGGVGMVVAAGPIAAVALIPAAAKGLYNMWQTQYNGADYHPISDRTEENIAMSNALKNPKIDETATKDCVNKHYAKMGEEITANYNQKNLVVTHKNPVPNLAVQETRGPISSAPSLKSNGQAPAQPKPPTKLKI